MSQPVVVDGIALSAGTDFAQLVRRALLGEVGGSLRSDNAPLDWVLRVYGELRGPAPAAGQAASLAGLLAGGVAACLTAAEPLVRSQALLFFQLHPGAPGGGRVLELLAGDRAPFAGVPDPLHPGVDLEWQLLAALGNRLRAGDEPGLALARAEVLRPGRAQPLVGALVRAAPDWVLDHAEQIVRATPQAGLTLLLGLQDLGRDLVAPARRIAPLCRADPRFGADAARFIDDPAARRAALDAFGGPPGG